MVKVKLYMPKNMIQKINLLAIEFQFRFQKKKYLRFLRMKDKTCKLIIIGNKIKLWKWLSANQS